MVVLRQYEVASFYSIPCGVRFQRVQVPNPPSSGKDIVEGKGGCVVCSERSNQRPKRC